MKHSWKGGRVSSSELVLELGASLLERRRVLELGDHLLMFPASAATEVELSIDLISDGFSVGSQAGLLGDCASLL